MCLLARVFGNEFDNDLCELLTFVFLQEVTSISNGYMWLISCTGHLTHKWLFAACCDRILIAKCAQEWFFKLAQYAPSNLVVAVGRIINGDRNKCWEDTRTRFVGLVWKRRIVCIDLCWRKSFDAATINNGANGKCWSGLREVAPLHESVI